MPKSHPEPWYRPSRGVWYLTLNGKQINLGADQTEAFRFYHELMSQPRPQAPKFSPVATISLPDLVDRFLDWVSHHRARETYGWYQYRLERLCRKYPTLTAESLKPYQVEEWVNDYELAVTTRRNYLRSVKRCYKWAKRQGFIDTNPIADLEVPSAEERDVSLSQEEYEVLMSYVRSAELADLLTVTWETGCRPQESLRVEARHIDLENQRWVFHRSESKTKRISRVIYLTDNAFAITKRLMLANPEGPIFRNSSGKPWSTDAVNCAFSAIRMRMGRNEMQRTGIPPSNPNL